MLFSYCEARLESCRCKQAASEDRGFSAQALFGVIGGVVLKIGAFRLVMDEWGKIKKIGSFKDSLGA